MLWISTKLDWYSDEIRVPFSFDRCHSAKQFFFLCFADETKNKNQKKKKPTPTNETRTTLRHNGNILGILYITSKYRASISRKCRYGFFFIIKSENWLFKLSQQISEHMPLRCCRASVFTRFSKWFEWQRNMLSRTMRSHNG